MSTQTVRVEKDSDERVAFDLYTRLEPALPELEGIASIEQHLKLFGICRHVVRTGGVNVNALS